MIKYVTGNILESEAQALVNTVNTVGIMGKGIALMFKKAFPENYKLYVKACKNKEIDIGKLFITKESTLNGEKIIINFPTKRDWRNPSKYEYIEKGLDDLVRVIKEYKIQSVAIPPLGSGCGGLIWEKVKLIIEEKLKNCNAEIIVYEPTKEISEKLKKERVKLTEARALMLIEEEKPKILEEARKEFEQIQKATGIKIENPEFRWEYPFRGLESVRVLIGDGEDCRLSEYGLKQAYERKERLKKELKEREERERKEQEERERREQEEKMWKEKEQKKISEYLPKLGINISPKCFTLENFRGEEQLSFVIDYVGCAKINPKRKTFCILSKKYGNIFNIPLTKFIPAIDELTERKVKTETIEYIFSCLKDGKLLPKEKDTIEENQSYKI